MNKKPIFYIILISTTMIFLASCQATPTPINYESIQNTAVSMAWTSVSQTRIASTPPTPKPTVPPPTPDTRSNYEKCSQSSFGVKYVIVGAGTTRVSLTLQNDSGGTEQTTRNTPICLLYNNFTNGDFLYISAQVDSENFDNAIRCYIYDGNKIIAQADADGFASIATCSGSK